MKERGKDFADLVYQVLVLEERWKLKDIAATLGLKYDTFYSRVRNRTRFSADEIRRLIAAAPDPRFVSYLLRETPFVAADRVPPDRCAEAEAIHRGATRIVLEAADVLEAIEAALADDRIDHRESRVILKNIEEAERAVATLREVVRASRSGG
ncbi:MAG: hypothetical protein D6773_05130 [Alphaproteobacteria bacterium]|nr:MAG: hypothetical protein D6773_05130 [Alphaproteobacteria bacterium]